MRIRLDYGDSFWYEDDMGRCEGKFQQKIIFYSKADGKAMIESAIGKLSGF